MSSPSNLYAEKIFSEHPLALWALDDNVDYISLIGENIRNLSSWSKTGCTASLVATITDEPFPESHTSLVIGDTSEESLVRAELISPDIDNFTNLSEDLKTFTIGTYIFSESSYISGFEIGYEYYDTTSGTNIKVVKEFDNTISGRWIFLSETFEKPSQNTTFRLILNIKYLGGAESTDDYHFLVNGITLGQWSEEFNSTSLGNQPISLPSSIALDSSLVLEAKAYGLQDAPGYYFVKDKALLAKNSGIPMTYGASNVTILSPNEDQPSLIVPGQGFLNELGRYRDYTVEFWLRAESNSVDPKRIFGPISSTDGLYIDGAFIRLKISDSVQSHFVGEWFRPMLIQIRVSSTMASLVINGEQVSSLDVDMSKIELPSETLLGKSQDWLGFYSSEDTSPVEIDCIAIYPYYVSSILAKRRWVYGQAVEFPENINTAYSGTSVFLDYQFANYANNYNYPDIGSWNQGVVENLSVVDGSLSTPKYSLPTLAFSNKTQDSWKEDNSEIQLEDIPFIRLRPNSEWNNTDGYILFQDINMLTQSTKAIFGIFKTLSHSQNPQELLRLENDTTGNYLSIYIQNSSIYYSLSFGSEQEIFYTAVGNNVGDMFNVGINLDQASSYFGGSLAAFLGNRGQVKLYVGGNKGLNNTFTGNIYKVGFCTERNFSKISSLFNEYGVPTDYEDVYNTFTQSIEYDAGDSYFGNNLDFWEYILDGGTPSSFASMRLTGHMSSYDFVPRISLGAFSLDINSDSYWEDYIPLSYFAKTVKDLEGKSVYSLDFLQLNINYPAPSIFSQTSENSQWSYSELQNEFASPTQKFYNLLDNELYTGYQNYIDLQNKSGKSYQYDTSNSIVKSYVSFQYLSSGANAATSFFKETFSAPKNGVIRPGSEWINTKYEFVDNMIIYPPKGVDFKDLAIVLHLDFKAAGILSSPIKIKKLQLASQALDATGANPIGTRFGTKIYPYRKSGIYLDYKSNNPFSIYKGTSPHLYLTRYSGIRLRGDIDPLTSRGLLIPINETLAPEYKTIAMQLSLRFNEDFFPYSPTQIFEIQSRNTYIKFYMVATHPSGKRAKIYAINALTGKLENGIAFYWNGKIVKEPTITIKEWGMLGMTFSDSLTFNSYLGSFRITGPVMINNFSHYEATNLQEVQQVTTRPWIRVKNVGALSLDWQYWDSAYIWNGVLVLASTSYYGVDPSDIYKTYTGTNKIIIDDERPLSFNSYKYSIIKDVSWQSSTLTAV